MSIEPLPSTDPYDMAEAAIQAAIAACLDAKIKVRPGTVGLMRGEMSGKWCEDPGELGVSPIGAYLLGETTAEDDAPCVAASDLLGVSNAFCAGVDDGFANEPEPLRWLRCAGIYNAGLVAGRRMRREFFREPQPKGPTR